MQFRSYADVSVLELVAGNVEVHQGGGHEVVLTQRLAKMKSSCTRRDRRKGDQNPANVRSLGAWNRQAFRGFGRRDSVASFRAKI